MKISRLLAILIVLLNREKVTAAELADRFEVSVRTIIRDMQTINEAGIPIISYQGYEGGYGLVEGYKIDKHLMSLEEMNIAISVLKGLEQVIGNQTIKSLLDKFELLSANGNKEKEERIQVDLTPWGISGWEKKKLLLLNEAVQKNYVVKLTYIDRAGRASERLVEPLLIGLKMSAWYLYAYCQTRQDFRLFKLTRIKELSLAGKEFHRKSFDSTQVFSEENSQPAIHIKMLFSQQAYHRVLDYFEMNQLKFQADGSILVEVDYPEDEWVYSLLLGFGANVEILEPTHLRDIVYRRAKEIVDKFSQ